MKKGNSHRQCKSKGPLTALAISVNEKPFDTEELVADNIGLQSIAAEDISHFPNLHSLYIPNNNITVLNNLNANIRIAFLDARNNQITDIDLSKQEYMRELYLSGNKLQDLDRILTKLIHMRDLQTLDLRGNPLTLEKGYRNTMIQSFPTLKNLDGLEVEKHERIKPKLVGVKATMKNRPRTVLQCLLSRPLSSADASVQLRAEKIRKARELKLQREEEERTAAARKLKEEFDAKAAMKEAPMAEGFDYLSKSMMRTDVKNDDTKPQTRARSRMYIKKPIYTAKKELDEGEERAVKLNPHLPPIFKANVRYEIMYPQ